MEKAVILWASPHDMLEEQERELKELFGDGAKIVNKLNGGDSSASEN